MKQSDWVKLQYCDNLQPEGDHLPCHSRCQLRWTPSYMKIPPLYRCYSCFPRCHPECYPGAQWHSLHHHLSRSNCGLHSDWWIVLSRLHWRYTAGGPADWLGNVHLRFLRFFTFKDPFHWLIIWLTNKTFIHSFFIFIYSSLHSCVRSSVHPSIYPYIHPSIHPSINLYTNK